MRVDRNQLQHYERFPAVWTHPDGATWKEVGTISFPIVNGVASVHAVVGMRRQTTQLACSMHRNLALIVTTDTGGGPLVDYVGAIGAPHSPGSTISYDSDLAAADMRFTASIVGANVEVRVDLQWPGLAGGQLLEVTADVWWEVGKDWPVA